MTADEQALLEQLEEWVGQVLQHFEGDRLPSEIQGKRLHTELMFLLQGKPIDLSRLR